MEFLFGMVCTSAFLAGAAMIFFGILGNAMPVVVGGSIMVSGAMFIAFTALGIHPVAAGVITVALFWFGVHKVFK